MCDVEAMLKERDRIIGKVRSYAAMEGLGELGTLQAAVLFALVSVCATVSDSQQAEAPTGDDPAQLHNAIRETVIAWEYYGGNIERMLKARLSGFRIPVVPVPVYEYGWAGDAKARDWYATREEAEEFMGDPKRFRRVKAGEWELVPVGVDKP